MNYPAEHTEKIRDLFSFLSPEQIYETLARQKVWNCNLDLRETKIVSIPEIEVNGGFDLNYCTSLTSLPVNLIVNGYLYLSYCTSLTSLPENLKVKSFLYLNYCTSLTSLPGNLKVNGYLDLSESGIKRKGFVKPKGVKGTVYW